MINYKGASLFGVLLLTSYCTFAAQFKLDIVNETDYQLKVAKEASYGGASIDAITLEPHQAGETLFQGETGQFALAKLEFFNLKSKERTGLVVYSLSVAEKCESKLCYPIVVVKHFGQVAENLSCSPRPGQEQTAATIVWPITITCH